MQRKSKSDDRNENINKRYKLESPTKKINKEFTMDIMDEDKGNNYSK
jgi:hypothetical protein